MRNKLAAHGTLALLVVAGAVALHRAEAKAAEAARPFGNSPYAAEPEKPSAMKSFTNSIKKGFSDFTDAFSPKPKSAADPTALNNPSKPSAETYLAVARMQEEAGNLAEADRQYRRAMKAAPENLKVLLGCAKWNGRQGHTEAALNLYGLAAEKHPKEPSVYNDMAMFLARQGRSDEAAATLAKAISLQPKKPLYRNNMAAILVDAGRPDAALPHLTEVHGAAAAHYNLGYLLQKKGQQSKAVDHFAQALRLQPSMKQAQAWLEHLGADRQQIAGDAGHRPMARRPEISGPRVADRRATGYREPSRGLSQPAAQRPSAHSGRSSWRLPESSNRSGNTDGPRASGIRELPPPPPSTAEKNRSPQPSGSPEPAAGSSDSRHAPSRLQQPTPPTVSVPDLHGPRQQVPIPHTRYLDRPAPGQNTAAGRRAAHPAGAPTLFAPRNARGGDRARAPITHLPPVVPLPDIQRQ